MVLVKQQMPRLSSFLRAEGKLGCLELRNGERGLNLILSAASEAARE